MGAKERMAGQMWALLVPLVISLAAGCAPRLIKLEPQELARVQRLEGEIRAVHYSPATLYVTGGIGDFDPISLVLTIRATTWVRGLSLEDPILRVKDRFVTALETEVGLKNLRTIPTPLGSDSLDHLRAELGKGVVLDFKTLTPPPAGGWALYAGIFWSTYAYSARARLIRLDDSRILWQGLCKISEKIPPLRVLEEDDGQAFKTRIEESAVICARQLIQQFSKPSE